MLHQFSTGSAKRVCLTVVFFKTIEPVEPVSLVYRICDDALKGKLRVRTRFTQRLTPMSMMGHASVESIDRIARLVLPSSFQEQPLVPRKVSFCFVCRVSALICYQILRAPCSSCRLPKRTDNGL